MYEMLVGYPPFYSDEPMQTCRKVMSGRWTAYCNASCFLFVASLSHRELYVYCILQGSYSVKKAHLAILEFRSICQVGITTHQYF